MWEHYVAPGSSSPLLVKPKTYCYFNVMVCIKDRTSYFCWRHLYLWSKQWCKIKPEQCTQCSKRSQLNCSDRNFHVQSNIYQTKHRRKFSFIKLFVEAITGSLDRPLMTLKKYHMNKCKCCSFCPHLMALNQRNWKEKSIQHVNLLNCNPIYHLLLPH